MSSGKFERFRSGFSVLTHEYLEMHGCKLSTMTTDVLVLGHQTIIIHNGDQIFFVFGSITVNNMRNYRQVSNIRRILVGTVKTSDISRTSVDDEIVDNPDVVGASPVGATPTTSSFST